MPPAAPPPSAAPSAATALRATLQRGLALGLRAGLRTGLRATVRPVLRAQGRKPLGRRLLQRASAEIVAALEDTEAAAAARGDGLYGGAYFGLGRDPADREGRSGYERYDRVSSHADVAAYLLWRYLPGRRFLDVGCATGLVVDALAELGLDAHGVDASSYALEHAAPGAAGRLEIGDLGHRLPSPDGGYDVVSVLETLEHLPPEQVGRALAELRRVCGGYLVATIPSFGENHNGPGGWFEGKVRGELVERYRSLGPGYEGPVTRDDLMRDAEGRPIEGHLTIASFAWWTRRFEEAGFARCGATERLLHPHLARFGLTKYWNLYVLRVPGTQEPVGETRSPEVVSELEARWGLDRRPADEDDLRRVAEALGP